MIFLKCGFLNFNLYHANLNSLFSFFFAEILSNLGSPHPVQEDAEKQPQADVKEGENHVVA